MTTTPPETGSDAGPPPQYETYEGPRVSSQQMRELGRLRRSRDDRKVAGVAGGLARHLDVDPLVLRIAFVVLTFFGGAGAIVYGACWLLVPEDGSTEATIRLDDRSRTVALFLVGAVAALALLGDSLGGGFWFPWPVLAVALVVYLVVSNRDQGRASAPPPAPPTGAAAPGHATEPLARHGIHPGQPTTPWPAAGGSLHPPRRPGKRGPLLFWFTLALAAVGVGVLGVLDAAGVGVADSAYPALVLATVGVMLVVGSFYGRAGGLILVGLLAALATAATTAAGSVDDERIEVTPTSADQLSSRYSHFGGEIVLDLTQVEDAENLSRRAIELDATVGRIEVVLPADLDVVINSDVRLGSVEVLGDQVTGEATTVVGDSSAGSDPMIIDIDLRLGEVEVTQEETP